MRLIFLSVSVISILAFLIVMACEGISGDWCSLISENSLILGSGAIHLTLLSLGLFFLWKKDLRSMLDSLGFPGEPKKVLLYTVASLIAIFSVLLIVGVLSLYFGFNDQEKVSEKINTLPIFVLAFAVFGAPITEELFFRGFLAGRFGVVISSLLFGFMHLAYGSTVEVIGAFLIGIVLALTFRLSKSITPCILAHMGYNTLAIIVMVLFT